MKIMFENACDHMKIGVPDGWISNLEEIVVLSVMRDDYYEKVQSLEKKKLNLKGKKNKKNRCKMNKKILMSKVELVYVMKTLHHMLMSQAFEKGSDAYKMWKESPRDRRGFEMQSVRFCNHCQEKMFDWKGRPCKKAWYCDRECQKKHRKIHKIICTC